MNNIATFLSQPMFYIPFLVWSIFWKGWALWKSAGRKQLLWFLILLTVNTMGILEIGYIFYLNKWDLDKGKTLRFLEKKFNNPKK